MQVLAVAQVQPSGQDVEVEPAEQAEGDDLEDRVEGDQDGGCLAVAAGQVVPDDDHGDAAGEADDDQAGAVGGQIGKEGPRQGEHHRRPDQPVDDQRGDHQPLVARDGVEPVVAHLGQHRIHHHQQADGDRQGDTADLDLGEGVVQPRHHPAQAEARAHGEQDPHGQETVEGGQFRDDRGVGHVRRGRGLGHGQDLFRSQAAVARAVAASSAREPARVSRTSTRRR